MQKWFRAYFKIFPRIYTCFVLKETKTLSFLLTDVSPGSSTVTVTNEELNMSWRMNGEWSLCWGRYRSGGQLAGPNWRWWSPLLTWRGQENKVSGISLQREFSLEEKQSHDSHHQIQRGSCGRNFESPVFGAPRGRAEEKRQKLQRGSICPNISRNFLTIHCSTLAKNQPLLRPLMTLRGKGDSV